MKTQLASLLRYVYGQALGSVRKPKSKRTFLSQAGGRAGFSVIKGRGKECFMPPWTKEDEKHFKESTEIL
jgi:hypothetical protein